MSAAVSRSPRVAGIAAPVLGALVFLAFHLPYLPSSLEDLDSINFALGIRQFDVAKHQPHPPGYPVFIAIAKAARRVATTEAGALAAISVVSGALGALLLAWLFRELSREDRWSWWPIAATALVICSPLYWVTAARPLSDMLGLAAAVAVQAATLAATSARGLAASAFCAGLAAGIRSQVLWLTAPLVVYRCFVGTSRPRGRSAAAPSFAASGAVSVVAGVESARASQTNARSVWSRRASLTAVAFAAGVLVWLIPLVVLTGGARRYWHALFDQGAEDFSGVRMLWTTPTPRALLDALYYAFVAPWAVWPTAAVVLAFALAGLFVLWRTRPRALELAAIAFGPYIAFDLLFQEFVTVRYALPVVLPVAWLAAAGLRTLPAPAAIVATAAIVMFDAHVGGRAIASLAREPAPVFRALADMRHALDGSSGGAVLAPDRRQSFDLRRPLAWLGADAPPFDRQLAAPPQHEWLEAVKYWDSGGRLPVWFVVDPRRAAIDLVQHGEPAQYRWSLPLPILLSGTRPNDLDWYRVDRPEWYVREGWSLTPESAGVADADRRGLAAGPIEGRVRRDVAGGTMFLGGRNFDPSVSPRIKAVIAGRTVADFTAAPGAFLIAVQVPADVTTAESSEYLPLAIAAEPRARVGIEQLDVSASRALIGFGAGWHERELNPVSGLQWRWLSDRGELRYVAPASGALLRISGESPRKYYPAGSRLVVRSADTVLSDTTVSSDFAIEVKVPAVSQPSTLIVETNQTHVPAETSWRRTADRRLLGLRIYKCEIRPVQF